MTLNEKQELLAEIFECDSHQLTPDRPLDELSWDSMAMLSVISLVKMRFNRKLIGAEIRAFKTVQDIFNVME